MCWRGNKVNILKIIIIIIITEEKAIIARLRHILDIIILYNI